MMPQQTPSLSSLINFDELYSHVEAISSFVRRGDHKQNGENGEAGARAYIERCLRGSGIDCAVSKQKGLLSFGREGTLRARRKDGGVFEVPVKAWNFSAPSDMLERKCKVVSWDAPPSVLELLASRGDREKEKDLAGCAVLSRSFSPQIFLDAESRGASAFVICWQGGKEKEIHHSGTVMWWGTPMPEESAWRPGIPVAAVNCADGERLISEADDLLISLSFELDEAVTDVFQVEATVPSTAGEPYFVLAGAHLDSKCFGATDNATGSAIALSLAQAAARLEDRRMGLRVCWWSGHEFGRYTGSSIYARDRFSELERFCAAYANIDMPGMKGAASFAPVTAGPDLFAVAERAVRETTGQEGLSRAPVRVRAWDQSFQNIGVSPFFIWTSALPEDSPYRTGSGNMPWWWHTEADTMDFCDLETLKMDASIYARGISELLTAPAGRKIFDVPALWQALITRLSDLAAALPVELYTGKTGLSYSIESLKEGLQAWRRAERSLADELRVVRLLNRVYYSARESYLQDWDNGGEFVPGLSEALRAIKALEKRRGGTERAKVIVTNYATAQINRIGLLTREILELIRYN